MRKRRVLAVLLALSLTVSGNSLTVLAAEPGTGEPVTVGEETPETAEEQEPGGSETPGTTEKPGESDTPGTAQKPEETGTPGTAEKPGESGSSETTENPGKTEESGETGTPDTAGEQEDPDAPAEDEAENPDVEEPAEDVEEEPEDPEKTDEDVPAAQPYVSRMVTFTDDTGMRILYDANASTRYQYVVANGVLTGVNIVTAGSDGTETTAPASFTGNVELKQPEEGEQYTSVAANVFSGNSNITYVKLPAGVETVADGAFRNCTALKSVYLPAGVTTIGNSAFEGCTAMTQISVPRTVTSIGDSAFKGDARLYLVFIKDMDFSVLQTIGASAFAGCSVLTAFASDLEFVLPSGLQSIGEAAFQNCRTIKNIDFTENVHLETMGEGAFEGCMGLTSLTFGKTLDRIAGRAFKDCIALETLNFPLVGGKSMTIEGQAFGGCYNLKELDLPQSVAVIKNEAFQGCIKLTRVTLRNDNIELEDNAFPVKKDIQLVIVATEGSRGYEYARKNGLLAEKDSFYLYSVADVNGTAVTDGKFPGGSIWVGTKDKAQYKDNINTQNKNKGVISGTECYIYQSQTKEQANAYTFIKESLRCNGQPVEKKDGKYFFKMPEGGAVITAEFRAKTPENIKGTEVKVEFSAGEPMENGRTDKHGYVGIELKVGQTTRMFLLDADGEPIPSAKIKMTSRNTKVATVNANGMITAVGTDGKQRAQVQVSAEVMGGDSRKITINRTVQVQTAPAGAITLKAYDYEKNYIEVSGETDGIQAAALSKTIVKSEPITFKLKANVYDETMDGVSRSLTWTTSNAKVATVAQKTTTAKDPVNTVTVQKGCEGEATITATATNPAGAKKAKVIQRFVVRVYKEGYKLASSTVTVNPKLEDSGVFELISAYGYSTGEADVELRYAKKEGSVSEFYVDPEEDVQGSCRKIHIRPVGPETIQEAKYDLRVCVNGDETNLMPLTVNVKRSTPNPTIKFNAKKAKFNLFYKDGRAKADAEPAVVMTEITKLGNAKISRVELQPLSDKPNEAPFTENFVIDEDNTDLAKGKVAIKRNAGNLQYTNAKDPKPIVAGYLVIYYEGYRDDAARKVKVTMPTCTTPPSYALRTTGGTYRDNFEWRYETFELFDKTSKTKAKVVLGEKDSVREANQSILQEEPQIVDGSIVMNFCPEKNAKMKFVLKNTDWDLNPKGEERTQSYVYDVKVSAAKPTIKASRTVTMNLNYPEREETFTLVPNQKGFAIENEQTFTAKKTRANASEIEKLEVTYENGEGTVRIANDDPDHPIKPGSYEFVCTPEGDHAGLAKVTLTVKVVNNKPDVKLGKGSLQLNKKAYENNNAAQAGAAVSSEGANDPGQDPQPNPPQEDTPATECRETAKISFTVNGKLEGYSLAPVGTGTEDTLIKCTTKNEAGAVEHFRFEVIEGEKENTLVVSLEDAELKNKTYSFSMTPRYLKESVTTVTAKTVKFDVKVIDNADIVLNVAAKGKINLVNRSGEPNEKNGILYTPTLKNIKGEITDVKIYDAAVPGFENESQYFDIHMVTEAENKNQAGKFFVTPKEGVELKNNQNYFVRIWVKVKDYAGTAKTNYGVMTKGSVTIKTAQVLPKVTTSRTAMNVYLSTKDYNASFIVKPKDGAPGAIESVAFGEKDEKSNDSLTLIQERQADGSLKVTVHLKEAVVLANGDNNVKFYVKYKGQGTNTSKTATGFTMKIKVN